MPKKIKTIDDAITQLKDLQKISEKIVKNDKKECSRETKKENIDIISKNYKELDRPNKMLEVYLKVLLSVLPLVEEVCKIKVSEYSVKSLTMLGDSIRQTIVELGVYKNPEDIMDDKITPNIQFHHDQVIKNIASQTSDLKNHLMEIVLEEKAEQADRLFIKFLKTLGESLNETYAETLDKIKKEILTVKGL